MKIRLIAVFTQILLGAPVMLIAQPVRVINTSPQRIFLLITRENDIPEIIHLAEDEAVTFEDIKDIMINNNETFSFTPATLEQYVGQEISDGRATLVITRENTQDPITLSYVKQDAVVQEKTEALPAEEMYDESITEAKQKMTTLQEYHETTNQLFDQISRLTTKIKTQITQLKEGTAKLTPASTKSNTQQLIDQYNRTVNNFIALDKQSRELTTYASHMENLKEDIESIYEVLEDKNLAQKTHVMLQEFTTNAQKIYTTIVQKIGALYQDMNPHVSDFEAVSHQLDEYLDTQPTWWDHITRKLSGGASQALETFKKGWRISTEHAEDYAKHVRQSVKEWYSSDDEEETSPAHSKTSSPDPTVTKPGAFDIGELIIGEYEPGETDDAQ